MSLTRLPKTTRWILIAACLFFVLLTLYRVVMYGIFSSLFTNPKPGILQAFLLGAAFDARIMAIIISVIYGLSFWPGIHFFKTSTGKKLALGLFVLAAAIVHVFYMADLVHLKCFHERLNGSIISELAKDTPKGNLFLGKVDYVPMIAVLTLVVWVVIYFLGKMHKIISNSRGVSKTGTRTAWHALVFLICVFCIYGFLGIKPLSKSSVEKKYNTPAIQLALTAPESFFTTLPIPSGK